MLVRVREHCICEECFLVHFFEGGDIRSLLNTLEYLAHFWYNLLFDTKIVGLERPVVDVVPFCLDNVVWLISQTSQLLTTIYEVFSVKIHHSIKGLCCSKMAPANG